MESTLRRALPLLLAAVACADETASRYSPSGSGSNEPPLGDPPVATLSAAPLTGPAPLLVTASGAGSTGDGLELRWDFDGDASFDTPWSAATSVEIAYDVPGTYTLVLEIRDAAGRSARASTGVTAEDAGGRRVDLLADTNRDGRLDAADQLGEAGWNAAKGAILVFNSDDDDRNGRRDHRDAVLNGDGDRLDLAPLLLRGVAGTHGSERVRLQLTPVAAAERVRIFRESGELLWDSGTGDLFLSDIAADVPLRLESTTGRTVEWDGELTITAILESDLGELARDEVRFRAAPTIFPDDTLPARVLYVMHIEHFANAPNTALWNALSSGLPDFVQLYGVDEDTYGADRWVQDNMQVGYVQLPGRVQYDYLQTERQTGQFGLEALLPYELLHEDLGFAYPSGRATSLNYGGNFEVAPPHGVYPLGRLLVGGGDEGTIIGQAYEDHMADEQRGWLEAQGLQGPALELSSEWLAVGHIDEIFLVIPAPLAGGWRIVIASPALARSALESLAAAGGGERVVFARREQQTTVAAILGDADLISFNQAAQARIDGIRVLLRDALGIGDDAFIDVPVLYEPVWYDGFAFGVAYNPGVQNLVSAGDALFIPDPEGPSDGSSDVWQQQIRADLEPLGLTVTFVDVFESYHVLMGEAHCGINVEREPYATAWWEVEP
jgi:protein-arginine deiminase